MLGLEPGEPSILRQVCSGGDIHSAAVAACYRQPEETHIPYACRSDYAFLDATADRSSLARTTVVFLRAHAIPRSRSS